MLVVRLFFLPGLFECGFREPGDCTWISKCHFEYFEQKSEETCTEMTKNKTRLFQSSLIVEVKFLSCKLSKAQNYMEILDMTFLQRLLDFTFSKVFKNSEKNQVFSQIGRNFGFTSIAPRAFKALLRNLSLLKNCVRHMLKSAFYKVVVGT